MKHVLSFFARRPYAFALALAVVLTGLNLVAAPQFGNPANWASSLGNLAPFVLVGLASTPSVLTGGVDVSIGPLATFINCLFIAVLIPHGLGSLALSLPILLVTGAAIGAINGVLVAILRFNPVVATLGMLFVLTGASLIIAANPIAAPHNWTSDLSNSYGWFPGALITIGVPLLLWWALKRTSFVRNIYSVGGDEVASFGAGVNVAAVKVLSYTLGGLFAAIAGIALTSIIQTSQSSLATTYALIALAAVVLGGTQLTGGRGGMIGTLFGAASIYFLQQLLSASGVSGNLTQLVYGLVLIVGVIISATLISTRSRRLS